MENNNQNPQDNPQAKLAYKPSSNMAWAVLTTIFCCFPFGIPAIIFAARVDSLWFSGRHQEAYNAARVSRNWALISAIVAASMSTADSQLLASSSAFASDVYKPVFRKEASNKEMLWAGRVVVIFIAIGIFTQAKAAKKFTNKHLRRQ